MAEFNWRPVEPNEKRLGDIDAIKARIEELKAERAQLVKMYDSEEADNALGAQMLRAGDEGAMYKFLRGQRDTRAMAEAQKANANMPTQKEFDRTLEALQATEAQMAGANVDPAQSQRMKLLADNLRAQLDDKLAKNPSLSRRNYGAKGNDNNTATADNLWSFKSELGYDGGNMTDAEIDAKAEALRKANPNVNGSEVARLVDEAKKRNETAYQKYVKDVDRQNAVLASLYKTYSKNRDPEVAAIIKSLGGAINAKTGGLVKLKKKDKDVWLKER